MVIRDGIRLHPYEQALIVWLRQNNHAIIAIRSYNGLPAKVIIDTIDGYGKREISIEKLAKDYGII